MTWSKSQEAAAPAADLIERANSGLLKVMQEDGLSASALSTFMYNHRGMSAAMPGKRSQNYTLESLAKIAAALGRRVEIAFPRVAR